MKRAIRFLTTANLSFILTMALAGQAPTSWSTDFSNPGNYGNWVSLDENKNPHEFIFNYDNEELHMAINKTSWHYVQLWLAQFNFKQNPYISFDLKTHEAMEITIGVKSGSTWQYEKSFTSAGSGSYEHIQTDFTAQSAGMTTDMDEMQFMVPFGNFTGELWLDNFRIGDAAVPPLVPEGTGFTLNFEGPWPDTTWKPNSQYLLNQVDGSLRVAVSKHESGKMFQYDFEGVYAISSNPYINIKARGDRPQVLWSRIWEGSRSIERKVRVYDTPELTDYCFDFSDSGSVFLGEIRMIELGVNVPATSFDGTLWLDDLKVGTDAARFANIAGIRDHSVYRDSKGNQILITDVEHVEMVTVAGAESLVVHQGVTAAGKGAVRMNFDCIDGATGTGTVTVTAHGADGWADHPVSFQLSVVENLPPVLDPLEDIQVKAGMETMLTVSGIGDGDAEVEQDLNLTASSSNSAVIDTIYVSYDSGPYAGLMFTSLDSGMTTITVTIDDGEPGNHLNSENFMITSFLDINNPPTLDEPEDLVVTPGAGEQVVTLTGITDGDDGSQGLTISAESSADDIIPNPVVVEYTGGETAQLKFTPDPAHTGTSTITVKVVDDGGTAVNDGNDSVSVAFLVETMVPALTGYTVPLGEGNLHDYLSAEEEGSEYITSVVDSGSFRALKIEMNDKWEFGGIWMDLPVELDLTDHPSISYDVFPVGSTLTATNENGMTVTGFDTYHWNYFYDVNQERNIKNSGAHMYPVPADRWTTLSFDYSDPGDMQTDQAVEINAERITAVLFNLHWRPGSWPFTNMSGTVYYRNIRIGDQAVIPEKTPVTTINGVPDQVQFAGSGAKTITLSGISDGAGGIPAVTASSRNSSIIPDPEVGEISNGRATLTYTVGEETGSSKITLTVSADGATETRVTFDIFVNAEEITESATVMVDREQTFQEIEGLGVHWLNPRHVDAFVNDMGGSVVRFWAESYELEPENDNDDPYVLNRDALDYRALNRELFTTLKEEGVDRVIMTILTPPAWMKRNLSSNEIEQAPYYEQTDNILEPYYFEEFAELLVAWVTIFREELGIDLYAVGLQNEPAFSEPYGSAVYSPDAYAQLIGVVGKRFEEEGITTKIFGTEALFYPNQYRFDEWVEAINDRPDADQYTYAIATHHFARNGKAGSVTRRNDWDNLWSYINQGSRQRVYWQTEESAFGASGVDELADAMYLAGMYRDAFQFGDMALNIWLTFYRPSAANDAGLLRGQDTTYLYQIHKHFYKYVRPGALRLHSESDNPDLLPLAFMHPEDGTYTLVLMNISGKAISFDLTGSNIPETFEAYTTSRDMMYRKMDPVGEDLYLLPPNSITTLFSTVNSPLTIDQAASREIPVNSPEQAVDLTGISDGSGSSAGITISATSTLPGVIPDPQVTDVSGDGTATLTFTPAADMTGSARISVTVENGKNSRTMSFYVSVLSAEGVNDPVAGGLKIYPNPAGDLLFIESAGPRFDRVSITDLKGRVMMNRNLESGMSAVTLDIRALYPGVYIVVADGEKGSARSRLIVK